MEKFELKNGKLEITSDNRPRIQQFWTAVYNGVQILAGNLYIIDDKSRDENSEDGTSAIKESRHVADSRKIFH